jgi:uncharacterized protein (DUF427 family)
VKARSHPIKIFPAEAKVRVTVGGRIVAESTRALRLEEKGYPPVYYVPRKDADMYEAVANIKEHLAFIPHESMRSRSSKHYPRS